MKLKSFFSSPWFLQIILLLLQTSFATSKRTKCLPSHCGNITNILYPFRLKDDPATCGHREYELTCQNNQTLLLPLFPGQNYHVKAINYNNFTVRLVDPAIHETDCSSIPRYFLSAANFSGSYDDRFTTYDGPGYGNYDDAESYEVIQNQLYNRTDDAFHILRMLQHVIYMNCSNPVRDDPVYVDTAAPCSSSNVVVNSHDDSKGHVYAIAGDLTAGSSKPYCHVKVVTPVSIFADNSCPTQVVKPNQTSSYGEIHRMLVTGFEVSWMTRICQDRCDKPGCFFNCTSQKLQCNNYHDCTSPLGYPITCGTGGHKLGIRTKGRLFLEGLTMGRILDESFGFWESQSINIIGRAAGFVLATFIEIRLIFGLIILFGKLIHIYWTRHASVYENIEDFLQGNSLMPIRYSYKDIKKMTKGFKDKLGEGGYGSVYKGKLRSGIFVGVKMLGKPKANGQEFISEVATIGRIHHGNVVQLIGFCVEASKRALVYEFMPKGSLDKYISSKEDDISLTYNQMYRISLGVARGISYLHEGCDMQILHFDIKPHNILLDENFNLKVSDFGLAKLYPINNSIVNLTAARGTIGYMAPELFYQNVGGVSYKADVYSFGMLLMEMANRRRNLNPYADNSSEIFLPFWIYDQLKEEREIEIGEVTQEEKNNVKKMFIVALWCIQLRPNDRPSMNKVIEMLEGDVESIIMPPKPSLYPTETIQDLENSPDSDAFSSM
ncbi:LEAF RUST 10 DISEASE-RESISTANCE LOCUS RECEPTOR-LIKE PROTEIN KINASE-like 2.2 isoform X2 [Lotus japonicus]|uniref:LEAF RUST 10 DISEASE-RESISTANCE LOCUS RECEPTOR-LIKE PROTEIN KINASE-like 2.2 isoform X2 n=1 Tax=Lotus japonicus TaxID=34305 RepID=UPI0025846E39|nr:LEAF RUST 10 DISEASE-RESISTANCE LOCUS RECEPTOR-LIKE PROTEIN KINASE-like 2.2 isoform X2 [Lotus japonicus]